MNELKFGKKKNVSIKMKGQTSIQLQIVLIFLMSCMASCAKPVLTLRVHSTKSNSSINSFVFIDNKTFYADNNGQIVIKKLNPGEYNSHLFYSEFEERIELKITSTHRDTTIWRELPEVKLIEGEFETNCPICNKDDKLIPIVYGEPTINTRQNVKLRKVILGGCIIWEKAPNYRCERDFVEFKLKN